MLEYISQHWYVGVALVLLAILTVFMFIMAIISGRKRNAERERIIAEIERQMRAAMERNQQTYIQQTIKPRKFEVDFSQLDELEDEE